MKNDLKLLMQQSQFGLNIDGKHDRCFELLLIYYIIIGGLNTDPDRF
jgi:hypothetical protein